MRLLPLLTALVIISFIDRSSVAFASLQMTRQLGLSASQHALGAGAFSLSYAVGQLPSAFALRRWGGPAWLGTTAAAWGCAAAACAASAGAVSFVLLRLLLGLAEPGGLPGVWAYMSTVYPPGRTALPFAVLEAGMTASSQVVAAPIAAGLLVLDGVGGLAGWHCQSGCRRPCGYDAADTLLTCWCQIRGEINLPATTISYHSSADMPR